MLGGPQTKNWGQPQSNGQWGINTLGPTTGGGTESCQQHEWVWKQILDHGNLEMTEYLANTMTAREDPPKMHSDFQLPELWDNKCCFKPLNSGIIFFFTEQ